MAKPKNPQPNHPFHDAAVQIEEEIGSLSAPPPEVTPPAVPDPIPAVTPEPKATPAAPAAQPAPASADVLMRVQQMLDTTMGRLEAVNEEKARLAAELASKDSNRQFLEQRLNEVSDEAKRAVERARELEGLLETTDATRGFTSDIVDQAQFAEIFRGIQPHLRRRDEELQRLSERNAALERKLDEVRNETRTDVMKLDQKWIDRSVLKSTPDITQLLQSPAGKEFLAQRIPGSRRTRMQELQDAYRDGDDQFISDLVADWKKLGAPVEVPSPDPRGVLVNQTPRAPTPDQPITEEMVSAAFQQVLDGKMTRADFRKLTKAQEEQLLRRQG